MKRIMYTTLLSIALIIAIGCGKKAENEAKDQTKAQPEAVVEKQDTPVDSIAAKTFPIRSADNKIVTIETDFGKMVLELYRDVAPHHADSFVARTNDGFYNGLIFHRVIDDFMIQGGDPKGDGTGNAGYFLPAEFNELPHKDGTLSMARSNSPNSASSQFFICLSRNRSVANLDRQYTVFGHLLKGYDVLHKIGKTETIANKFGQKTQPAEEIVMRKVYLSDAEGNAL